MKNKIVIATTLKPVDDIRSWHKLGVSLWQTNKYVLKIIGHRSKILEEKRGVEKCPYPFDPYLPLFRLFIPFFYLLKIWKFRPSVQIICSWELLPIAIFYKGIFGSKVVYDVQENYSLNVLALGKEPPVLKKIKSSWIRMHEQLAFPFIDEFWCAEPNYPNELRVPPEKIQIFLNKALEYKPLQSTDKVNFFLFSGTVGPGQGLNETLEWWRSYRPYFPDWSLWIMGHCPDAHAFKQLQNLDLVNERILLQVDKKAIPYAEIQKAILKSRAGILAYNPNKATRSKIPTKLFEYAANGCCILQLHPNPTWSNWIQFHKAGFNVFSIQAGEELSKILLSWHPPHFTSPDLFWESQEKVLLQSLDQLCS